MHFCSVDMRLAWVISGDSLTCAIVMAAVPFSCHISYLCLLWVSLYSSWSPVSPSLQAVVLQLAGSLHHLFKVS